MSAAKRKPTDPLIKVSADCLLLPRSAAEWSGVYIQAAELLVARRPIPKAFGFKAANGACTKFDLCGVPAQRSIGVREYINHVVEFNRYGPAVDTDFFTIDDPWQWIWTCDECAPASYAYVVGLNDGGVGRHHHGHRFHALAVRAGQSLSLQLPKFLARGAA